MDAPVTPGEILLGKYRVERILGQGGMGVVVAARHLDLDELFAIKLMLPAFSQNTVATERFLREARAAAKLKGDHVAKVQDVGRLPDGTSYMVMEYLTGSDLKDRVRQNGPLPLEEAVTCVLQACDTLREAHAAGIVHRDIKPANIFLTRGPNGAARVKVIDFGISKQTGPEAVGLTTTSSFGGSPLYMSPEQMRSAKHVDHRTDIWSMGIVLYELLTATTPFHADTITAVAGRVLQDEPVPVSHLRLGIPPTLDAIVLRCLAKSPDARFQSIDELMMALRATVPQEAVGQVAFGGSTVPLARTSAASNSSVASFPRDTAPLPEPSVATQPASTTAGFGQSANIPQPPARTPQSVRSKRAPLIVVLAALGLAIASAVFVGLRSSADSTSAGPDRTAVATVESVQPSAVSEVSTSSSGVPPPREPATPPPALGTSSTPLVTPSGRATTGQVNKPLASSGTLPGMAPQSGVSSSALVPTAAPTVALPSTSAAKTPVPTPTQAASAPPSTVRKSEPLY